jgi:GNAT superfamily N-acetyltransferase
VERTEAAEIEALRSMFAAVPADVASELGASSLDLAEAIAVQVRFLSGLTEANHALGISTAEQLDRLPGFYGETAYAVSPAPSADLDIELRRRRYEPGYAWMKFARGTGSPPRVETELHVVEAGPAAASDFGRTVVEGSRLPPRFAGWLAKLPGRDGWQCFVAYDGDEPAGAGALFVCGSACWAGFAATRPEFRRRGAQGAILAARIRRAAELGCTLVVTETGELVDDRPSESYRNILRAGFEPQYLRANYMSSRPRLT